MGNPRRLNARSANNTYKDLAIGLHILDMVIEQRVILELKAVAEILPIHLQQALGYLRSTGFPLALMINFGAERVQFYRIAKTNK